MKLYVLGTMLSKPNGWTTTTRTIVGYQNAQNENEARGGFVKAVQDDEQNKGFTMGEVVLLEVPPFTINPQ